MRPTCCVSVRAPTYVIRIHHVMISCAVRFPCLEASSQEDGDPELAWQTVVRKVAIAAAADDVRQASYASKGSSSGRRAKQRWWAQIAGQRAERTVEEEDAHSRGTQASDLLSERRTLTSLRQLSPRLDPSSVHTSQWALLSERRTLTSLRQQPARVVWKPALSACEAHVDASEGQLAFLSLPKGTHASTPISACVKASVKGSEWTSAVDLLSQPTDRAIPGASSCSVLAVRAH